MEAIVQLQCYSNLCALANNLSIRSTALYNKVMQYLKAPVQPDSLDFNSKLSNEFSNSLDSFKAACLFVSSKIQEMKPNNANIIYLKALTFLMIRF